MTLPVAYPGTSGPLTLTNLTLTGIASLAAGSATAPSLTFTGDTNTGIYSAGADQINVTTGGTLRVSVSTTLVTSTLPITLSIDAAGADAILKIDNTNAAADSNATLQLETNAGTMFVRSRRTVGDMQFGIDATTWATLTGSLLSVVGSAAILNATAIPAGGTAGSGYKFSSTSNFGVFFGSGAPSLIAAKGSLYLRSDGSTTNDRAYLATDGSGAWTALVSAT